MSKIFFILLTGCLFCKKVIAQDILYTVSINQINKKEGKIYLGVYNSDSSYMNPEKAIVKKIVAVKNQSDVNISIDNLPAGNYAVVVFLDENNNGKLDTNLIGIPKEKYGFSGSVKPMFRAPNFAEASVMISPQSPVVSIKLN